MKIYMIRHGKADYSYCDSHNFIGHGNDLAPLSENNISEYIVATIDDRVVGFCRIGKNKKGYPSNYAEIYALYINEDYKGQKIGTSLVKYSFSILSDKYDFCLISTLKENSANDFYKKINGNFIGTCKFNVMDNSYIENIYEFKI